MLLSWFCFQIFGFEKLRMLDKCGQEKCHIIRTSALHIGEYVPGQSKGSLRYVFCFSALFWNFCNPTLKRKHCYPETKYQRIQIYEFPKSAAHEESFNHVRLSFVPFIVGHHQHGRIRWTLPVHPGVTAITLSNLASAFGSLASMKLTWMLLWLNSFFITVL